MAVQGAYVSLVLARAIAIRNGLPRRLMLAASAFALGTGIWTMHFVGMLAFQLPAPVDYDLLMTLVSALAAILAVGVSVALVVTRPPGPAGLLPASGAMGLGIATMHYLGMAAMRVEATMHHDLPLVALSVAVAIAASFLSLWLAFGPGRKPPLVLAAVAMALAISGMHYTAMLAVHFSDPGTAVPAAVAPTIPSQILAVVVAVVAFLISAAFLLVLVPEERSTAAFALATEPAAPAAAAPVPVTPPADPQPGGIPVLKNGVTLLLRPEDIVAVEADAHYTHVFDGHTTYFCGLSISELERRLDPSCFLRVHRSHIVRKQAIAGFRRQGSHGRVRLSCNPPREVPVSRGRILTVQQALGL